MRVEIDAALAERGPAGRVRVGALTQPGLGADSVLLGAAEMALEPLFVDPVSALGSAIHDIRARLAG